MMRHNLVSRSSGSDPAILQRLLALEKIFLTVVFLVGTIVLTGWLIPIVGAVLPAGWSLMKANTALCCLLSALGFALERPQSIRSAATIGKICGAIILILASSALFGHLTGRVLGLETFLAADAGAEIPGRMSAQTATCFAIMGCIILLEGLTARGLRYLNDSLSVALLLTVLVITAGYCFGAVKFIGQSAQTRTSPHTLLCLALLAATVASRRSVSGYFSAFSGKGIGSRIARIEVFIALLLPFLIEGVIHVLEHSGIVTHTSSIALSAAVISSTLLVFIGVKARKINQLEGEIASSLSFVETLVNTTPDPVFYCDQNRRFIGCNRAFENLVMDVPHRELLGRPVNQLTLNTMTDFCINLQDLQWETDPGKFYTASLKCLDGITREFMFRTAPFDSDTGLFSGTLVILRDVSALKEMEQDRRFLQERLYESQKADALGGMVGGLSHDLNNMLQIITGYSEALLSGMKKGDRSYRELEAIHNTAAGGAELVKKLITFGQQARSEPVTLNLNQQIRELVPLLTKTLPEGVDIEFILTDKPALIRVDPGQFAQMIANISLNAAEAMPDGGRILFRTALTTLDDAYCKRHAGTKPGNFVMISISDNGRGMQKDILGKIFDPFFSTKQRGATRGTGLGLAVVQGIVHQHNGHITCESQPGERTTFRIFFPALDSRLVPVRKTVSSSANSDNQTVLLVEDTTLTSGMEERILKSAGYNLILAHGGKQALEIYEERFEEIDMVLLDLLLPDIPGKDCLMGMVRINPLVKVLVVSGFSVPDDLRKSIEPFMRGFLPKPVKAADLVQKVFSIINDE